MEVLQVEVWASQCLHEVLRIVFASEGRGTGGGDASDHDLEAGGMNLQHHSGHFAIALLRCIIRRRCALSVVPSPLACAAPSHEIFATAATQAEAGCSLVPSLPLSPYHPARSLSLSLLCVCVCSTCPRSLLQSPALHCAPP